MKIKLPDIIELAERLMRDIELAVRRFTRYHKYATGTRLREQAMNVANLASRSWFDRGRREEWLGQLVFAVDDLKSTMRLGIQVQAFRSFNEFSALYALATELGGQSGGWKKDGRLKGQNEPAQSAPAQRAQILSTHAASSGAHP